MTVVKFMTPDKEYGVDFFNAFAGKLKIERPELTQLNTLMMRVGGSDSESDIELWFESYANGREIVGRIHTLTNRAWRASEILQSAKSALEQIGFKVVSGPDPKYDKARENKAKRDAIKRAEESETTTSEG